jgi:hypothetical protein
VLPQFLNNLGPSGLLILAFLTVWFLLTVANQLTNRHGDWVRKINSFGFIPGWTFFAPTPGILDYRLVYRDILADGTLGIWQEVDWCQPRRWLDALWYPKRYATKLVVDSINGLAGVLSAMAKEGIDVHQQPQGMILSTPYIVLLNIVMGLPRQSPDSVARQMALFQQDALACKNQPDSSESIGTLMLCSSAHKLE